MIFTQCKSKAQVFGKTFQKPQKNVFEILSDLVIKLYLLFSHEDFRINQRKLLFFCIACKLDFQLNDDSVIYVLPSHTKTVQK